MKVKAHIFADKTKNALKIKSFIEKKIQSISLTKSKLIVVIGGDGFMLHTLKKFYKLKKPFYGINSGSYGFLMNKFSKEKTHKNLSIAKSVKINPLTMTVINKKKTSKKIYCYK